MNRQTRRLMVGDLEGAASFARVGLGIRANSGALLGTKTLPQLRELNEKFYGRSTTTVDSIRQVMEPGPYGMSSLPTEPRLELGSYPMDPDHEFETEISEDGKFFKIFKRKKRATGDNSSAPKTLADLNEQNRKLYGGAK